MYYDDIFNHIHHCKKSTLSVNLSHTTLSILFSLPKHQIDFIYWHFQASCWTIVALIYKYTCVSTQCVAIEQSCYRWARDMLYIHILVGYVMYIQCTLGRQQKFNWAKCYRSALRLSFSHFNELNVWCWCVAWMHEHDTLSPMALLMSISYTKFSAIKLLLHSDMHEVDEAERTCKLAEQK